MTATADGVRPAADAPGAREAGGRSVPGRVRRRAIGLVVAVTGLLLAVALSFLVGSSALTPDQVAHALLHPSGSTTDQIVRDLRLPRTVAALLVGAGLGAAGALIQAFTRNPLGDPGILGVSAGAAVAVALGIALLGAAAPAQYLWFAFGGALVTTVVVMAVGAVGRSVDPIRVTLAGVAIAAILTGVTSAMTLLDPVTFARMRGWEAGTFVERGFDVLLPATPLLVVGLVLALVIARPLNALGLGDDLAAALGARVQATRIAAIVGVTLLAGAATAIAGPVAFVGLMIPHIARWFTGPDQRWIIPFSIVLAPTLLLLSDVLGRVLLWPSEVPVGIVTAFLGAPVLIALVRRRRVSAL